MTATFGTIYVIFKKCVALISAIMMLVVRKKKKAWLFFPPAPIDFYQKKGYKGQ